MRAKPTTFRKIIGRLSAVLFICLGLIVYSMEIAVTAQGQDGFAEAIGFMEKERSLGDSYAAILREFGKVDLNVYASGISRYAVAKAEYDGLITQLQHELKSGGKLASSQEFQAKLRNAADHRIAFTSLVDEKVIKNIPPSKNTTVIAVIAAVPQLIEALTKAATAIWEKYGAADATNRKEIIDQLERSRWKPFDIAGKQ